MKTEISLEGNEKLNGNNALLLPNELSFEGYKTIQILDRKPLLGKSKGLLNVVGIAFMKDCEDCYLPQVSQNFSESTIRIDEGLSDMWRKRRYLHPFISWREGNFGKNSYDCIGTNLSLIAAYSNLFFSIQDFKDINKAYIRNKKFHGTQYLGESILNCSLEAELFK